MKARNLEQMKSQTFGVEVEMNSITRERAAQVAANYFGTGNFRDTRSTNGYYTWSAFDGQGREWKFSKDVSIAGPDSEKCELVTPILHYEDIETLQELVRKLRDAGAKSDATRGCGIHIHVGGNGHTPKSLRTLVNIMASHEEILSKALNLAPSRMSDYCKTVDPRFLEQVNREKPNTMDKLEDIWYVSQHQNYGRGEHYNHSRYHMLNLHSFFHGHGTIEFRLFQFDTPVRDGNGKLHGGIHAGQLKAYIQLCLALSQSAKELGSANPKKNDNQNSIPKTVMNRWLTRMGLAGDEFKTARMFLTKKLKNDRREVA